MPTANPYPNYTVQRTVTHLNISTADETAPDKPICGSQRHGYGFATLKCDAAVDVYLATFDEVIGEWATGGKIFGATGAGIYSLRFQTGPQTWGLILKNNAGDVTMTAFPAGPIGQL